MSEDNFEDTDLEVSPNLPIAKEDLTGMISVEQSRAIQEVQAAMVIAKRFPRDEDVAYTRVMKSCKRKSLANCAIYKYPRGGQSVEGPSIRLAETLGRAYGNLDFGIKILERKENETIAMVYCWDLETNVRAQRIFQVRHIRDRKASNGGSLKLTEERDIYELVANMGARRLRACILSIIPGDIVEDAVNECKKTRAAEAHQTPVDQRRRAMLVNFETVGVTQAMIEKYLKHPTSEINHEEIDGLFDIFLAIRDKVGKREDYFEFQRNETPKAQDLNARINNMGGENGNSETGNAGERNIFASAGTPGTSESDDGNSGAELETSETVPSEALGSSEQSDEPPTSPDDEGAQPESGPVNEREPENNPGGLVRPASPVANNNPEPKPVPKSPAKGAPTTAAKKPVAGTKRHQSRNQNLRVSLEELDQHSKQQHKK
jgi:hypothetical protein